MIEIDMVMKKGMVMFEMVGFALEWIGIIGTAVCLLGIFSNR